MGAGLHERYVCALIAEMRASGLPRNGSAGGRIDTVYIGGGTPTALPPSLLCKLLREVQQLNLASDAEITLEMNPSTNQLSALAEYARHGVNRLSIGLQAWQDKFLRGLKRAHTAAEFTQTMHAAREAGIDNINVDLMFGLPWQSMWHWRESITQVIAHAPQHISAYSLTPAENTPLWDAIEAGKLTLPSEKADREMYHEAIRMFTAAGYEHYELSNFAKPGYKSRHNVDCWRRKPYLGLGLGAHSFDGEKRFRNTMDMRRYLDAWGSPPDESPSQAKPPSLEGGGPKGRGLALTYHSLQPPPPKAAPPSKEGGIQAKSGFDTTDKTGKVTPPPCTHEDIEVLTKQDAMAETMFLGLRMTKGVSTNEFYKRFGIHLTDCYGTELKLLTAKGLITCTPERVALTPLGLDLANQVFEVFI